MKRKGKGREGSGAQTTLSSLYPGMKMGAKGRGEGKWEGQGEVKGVDGTGKEDRAD